MKGSLLFILAAAVELHIAYCYVVVFNLIGWLDGKRASRISWPNVQFVRSLETLFPHGTAIENSCLLR